MTSDLKAESGEINAVWATWRKNINFTLSLSRVFPEAPCVDPGSVIMTDTPHHTQTVRLHTEQVTRNLTPEPDSHHMHNTDTQ